MKTKNHTQCCKHPSAQDTSPAVNFLCHQSQDSVLFLVSSWWDFPKEAYGIIHSIIMLLDENHTDTKHFAQDLRFLRELLLTKNLMRHCPDIIQTAPELQHPHIEDFA